MKKRLLIFGSIFLAGLLIPALLCADLYLFARRPAAAEKADAPVIFHIAPGEAFRTIAGNLKARDLITSPTKFRLLARILEADHAIIAGEYEISRSMTPLALLKTFTDGSVRLHRLSVPEGLTLRETAAKVAAAGFASMEAFMAAAEDPEMVRAAGVDAPSLEGFLFPDTYYFSRDVSPAQIIQAMTGRFHAVFRPEWKTRAEELGFSVLETVTLASMIEKETGAAEERPLISSVFHNRLGRKMRLASDPTVIYGIKDFNGNLTRKDLTTLTPYNTYMIKGLPPGPIASPGAAALHAALFPAQTEYLYFVSKNDGTHHFSATLEGHETAVRKYQLGRP